MSIAFTDELTSEEVAEIKAAIDRMFLEIELDREEMKRSQERIEHLEARTRARLAEIKAMLV